MEPLQLLRQWHLGLQISASAHYEAAKYYRRRNVVLGVLMIGLSTVAATVVLGGTEGFERPWLKPAAVCITVLVPVLAGIQTFLGLGELSTKHKAAADKYGPMRRELEEIISRVIVGTVKPVDQLKLIRDKWDILMAESPTIPSHLYKSAQAEVAAREHSRLPDQTLIAQHASTVAA